jgi:hypothetical protein
MKVRLGPRIRSADAGLSSKGAEMIGAFAFENAVLIPDETAQADSLTVQGRLRCRALYGEGGEVHCLVAI